MGGGGGGGEGGSCYNCKINRLNTMPLCLGVTEYCVKKKIPRLCGIKTTDVPVNNWL